MRACACRLRAHSVVHRGGPRTHARASMTALREPLAEGDQNLDGSGCGCPHGGFKWSSQHLDGSCDEHSKTALGSFWAGALVLTRSTAGGRARGAAAILGGDW